MNSTRETNYEDAKALGRLAYAMQERNRVEGAVEDSMKKAVYPRMDSNSIAQPVDVKIKVKARAVGPDSYSGAAEMAYPMGERK